MIRSSTGSSYTTRRPGVARTEVTRSGVLMTQTEDAQKGVAWTEVARSGVAQIGVTRQKWHDQVCHKQEYHGQK